MTDEDIKKLITFWMQHWLAVGLQEPGVNGPEFDALMDELGELVRSRAERGLVHSDAIAALAKDPNPWLLARAAMMPALVNAPLILSGGMWEWLAERTKEAADTIGEVAAATAAVVADGATPTGEVVLEDAEWFLTLSLRRIKCVKETGGFFLSPDAGQDDFSLMGNWRYDGGKYETLRARRGKFDSDTSMPAGVAGQPESQQPEFAPAIPLANVKIEQGNDFKVFEANIFALEDDGMSAAEASAFAYLLGGLATVGINLLFKSIEVKTGVEIPSEAKEAFENYGIAGLIGVIAGAFGPEAFVPKTVRVRTKLKRNDPADRPEWRSEIVQGEASMVRKVGSDIVKGDFLLREGELIEVDIDGNDVPNFAEDLDEGQYKIFVQVEVKQT